MDFKKYIRVGKTASDLVPLFANSEAFITLINRLFVLFNDKKINKVACIEARGFILGGALAMKFGVGVVPIRKSGKLQNDTYVETFTDYSGKEKTLEIQKDSVTSGDNVLIVDDWLETGESVKSSIKLIEKCGGRIVGIAVFMDDSDGETREYLKKYDYRFIEKVTPEDKF